MHVEVTKKRFTVDEYYRMEDAGIFGPEDRTELIDGEVILMGAPGNKHVGACNRANTLFTEALGRRVIVSVQNPLLLDTYNEPQPDIIILKPQQDFIVRGAAVTHVWLSKSPSVRWPSIAR
jgi:Uma2 family endonuclease